MHHCYRLSFVALVFDSVVGSLNVAICVLRLVVENSCDSLVNIDWLVNRGALIDYLGAEVLRSENQL